MVNGTALIDFKQRRQKKQKVYRMSKKGAACLLVHVRSKSMNLNVVPPVGLITKPISFHSSSIYHYLPRT